MNAVSPEQIKAIHETVSRDLRTVTRFGVSRFDVYARSILVRVRACFYTIRPGNAASSTG